MAKTRTLILNCTQAEAEYRLKQQLRIWFPNGKVSENAFAIYKNSIGSKQSATIFPDFRFSGTFQQSGSQTVVSYQVYPFATIVLICILSAFALMHSIYSAIFLNRHALFSIVPLPFVAVFLCLISLYHQKKCIADFEKKLTTETHHNN